MKKLMVQYGTCPKVDFRPFMDSEDCGLKMAYIVEAAKGNIIIDDVLTKEDYRDYLFKQCMNYVGRFLRNWNGWTWQWYVNEFCKIVGVEPF